MWSFSNPTPLVHLSQRDYTMRRNYRTSLSLRTLLVALVALAL